MHMLRVAFLTKQTVRKLGFDCIVTEGIENGHSPIHTVGVKIRKPLKYIGEATPLIRNL